MCVDPKHWLQKLWKLIPILYCLDSKPGLLVKLTNAYTMLLKLYQVLTHLNVGLYPRIFFLSFLFYISIGRRINLESLQMLGFEPPTSGVKSDHSANFTATKTFQPSFSWLWKVTVFPVIRFPFLGVCISNFFPISSPFSQGVLVSANVVIIVAAAVVSVIAVEDVVVASVVIQQPWIWLFFRPTACGHSRLPIMTLV